MNDLLVSWKFLVEAATGVQESTRSYRQRCYAQSKYQAFHTSLPFDMISSLYTLSRHRLASLKGGKVNECQDRMDGPTLRRLRSRRCVRASIRADHPGSR